MAATSKTARRTATRARRRQQLINATMKCIARKGIGNTTLRDVAGEAGLSQGIVNLHFDSKDNLLTETLQYLANDYKTEFDKVLETSGPRAADKLLALMELDLRPDICDRRKIAVWFAFWGEVKSMPTYRKICDVSDRYYDSVVESLCAEVIAEGKYENIAASATTLALTSMTNGFWLSYLISPRAFDRSEAMDAVRTYLVTQFPKHYS